MSPIELPKELPKNKDITLGYVRQWFKEKKGFRVSDPSCFRSSENPKFFKTNKIVLREFWTDNPPSKPDDTLIDDKYAFWLSNCIGQGFGDPLKGLNEDPVNPDEHRARIQEAQTNASIQTANDAAKSAKANIEALGIPEADVQEYAKENNLDGPAVYIKFPIAKWIQNKKAVDDKKTK